MDDILKQIAPVVRELGFRGSGQTYRKHDGDWVFVINVQGGRWGDVFYVNLGAQPTFIPAARNAALKTLKESECMLRRRVGSDWPRDLAGRAFERFVADLTATQHAFFSHAATLRAALTRDTADTLIEQFSAGTTAARGALHLARAALALGYGAVAHELANRGLALAGPNATLLLADLQDVLRIPAE